MAYEPTGLQALFPIYLSRMPEAGTDREMYNIAAAQNEANLNRNLEILTQKLGQIEAYLAAEEQQ